MVQIETLRFGEEWDLPKLKQRLTEPLLDLECTDSMKHSFLRGFSGYSSSAYNVLASVQRERVVTRSIPAFAELPFYWERQTMNK